MDHVHFDMTEIDRMIAASQEELRPYLDRPDFKGVQSRLNFNIAGPIRRCFADETNRDTTCRLLVAALAGVINDAIFDLANGMAGGHAEPSAIVALHHEFVARLADCADQRLSGAARHIHTPLGVAGQSGGRA